MNHDEPELRRGEALLRRGEGSDAVFPAEPAPPARDVGARGGFGRAWAATSLRAAVYLFDSYEEASAAEERLKAQLPEGRQGDGTVNGALLLWTHADATDEAGRSIIPRLLSAFAGDE